jgi:hypothetical protein
MNPIKPRGKEGSLRGYSWSSAAAAVFNDEGDFNNVIIITPIQISSLFPC